MLLPPYQFHLPSQEFGGAQAAEGGPGLVLRKSSFEGLRISAIDAIVCSVNTPLWSSCKDKVTKNGVGEAQHSWLPEQVDPATATTLRLHPPVKTHSQLPQKHLVPSHDSLLSP